MLFINAHTQGKLLVTCPCGENFLATQVRVDEGRGKTCSKVCGYRYRVRPTGLTYQKHKENPTSFKPGHIFNRTGADSPNWKGDQVGYKELHRWVIRLKERPAECEQCGITCETDWANISHEYRRDVEDWAALCRPCHGRHDSGENRGKGVELFGRPYGRRIA